MSLNTIYNADAVEIADESTECWADIPSALYPNEARPCGRYTDHPTGLCPQHYQEIVLLAKNPLDEPDEDD